MVVVKIAFQGRSCWKQAADWLDRGGLSVRTNINTAPRYREQSLGSTCWTKLGTLMTTYYFGSR